MLLRKKFIVSVVIVVRILLIRKVVLSLMNSVVSIVIWMLMLSMLIVENIVNCIGMNCLNIWLYSVIRYFSVMIWLSLFLFLVCIWNV